MQAQQDKQQASRVSLTRSLQGAALLLLVLLSVLVAACGGSTTTGMANLGNPPVTVTVNLGGGAVSPTPPLPNYWCGAWATNTSPVFNTTSSVGVYAKFMQNVNGNPEGINNATAQATVIWPGGGTSTQTVQTTSDGLAVFYISIANEAGAVNQITYITVSFTAPNGSTCNIGTDRAAFFTLTVVSPTPTKGTPGSTNGKGTPPATGPGTPVR